MTFIKEYLRLTKPGIIRGNLITATAGFFVAYDNSFDYTTLLALLVGSAFVVAASCVINNITDRHLDSRMKRTHARALASGAIRIRHAALYAAILMLVGLTILTMGTNVYALAGTAMGAFLYTTVYGFAKRRTSASTLIGSIPGALPPVIGYTAYTARLDLTALILFLILVTWQMAHFYGISLYRLEDYKQAKLPLLPIVHGIERTKTSIRAYSLLFVYLVPSLIMLTHLRWPYGITMMFASLYWLRTIWSNEIKDSKLFGKKVFLRSLIVITVWASSIVLDAFI